MFCFDFYNSLRRVQTEPGQQYAQCKFAEIIVVDIGRLWFGEGFICLVVPTNLLSVPFL